MDNLIGKKLDGLYEVRELTTARCLPVPWWR